MIYVRLACGLGNQMHRYAFGYAKAKRENETLTFDTTPYIKKPFKRLKRHFELDQFCITQTRYCTNIPYMLLLKNLAKCFSWVKYFDDDFQNEKYFADYADDIRKEFQFKEKLQAPEGNTVAVHVRRGDYVWHPNHLVCLPSYYENAVAYICERVENPVFYVFSEDVEWCKENIKFPQPCFYVDNTDKPSSHDMQLMSLCKHNIIANSTYSWWAAWLNSNPDKIVIAPDKLVVDSTGIDNINDIFYTDDMVRISTEKV